MYWTENYIEENPVPFDDSRFCFCLENHCRYLEGPCAIICSGFFYQRSASPCVHLSNTNTVLRHAQSTKNLR